jgi:hypothetical protein
VSTRLDLETALAEAEIDLANAARVFARGCEGPTEATSGPPEVVANLAKARARCIAARNSLAKLNRVEVKPSAYRYERRRLAHQAVTGMPHINRRKASKDRRLPRPAMVSPNRAELIIKSDGCIDKLMRRAVDDPKPGAAHSHAVLGASAHLIQSIERPVCLAEESIVRQQSPGEGRCGLAGHFARRKVGDREAPAWRSLVWQSVELCSLILAYLQYYFVDIKLQIAMLPPSVGMLLTG